MSDLSEYIRNNTTQVPVGSVGTVSVVFFGVKVAEGASAEVLRNLIGAHKGEFGEVDLFDGAEHGYIEVGAWLGSQGMALELIGLGSKLELWSLLSPRTMLGELVTAEQELELAKSGLISLQAVRAQSSNP